MIRFFANASYDFIGVRRYAYGVTATLTCPTCPAGVVICKSTATYGDIPPLSGSSYSVPDNGFQVAIPSGLAAGSALPWVVSVSATNPYSTTVNVPTEPLTPGLRGEMRSFVAE